MVLKTHSAAVQGCYNLCLTIHRDNAAPQAAVTSRSGGAQTAQLSNNTGLAATADKTVTSCHAATSCCPHQIDSSLQVRLVQEVCSKHDSTRIWVGAAAATEPPHGAGCAACTSAIPPDTVLADATGKVPNTIQSSQLLAAWQDCGPKPPLRLSRLP